VPVVSGDIVERLRNWDDGRVSTHYEGCWDSHPVCAIRLAADAIEARDAEIERLRAEVERQRSIADTAWRKMDDAINERAGKHLTLLAERALADQLHNALCLVAVNLSGPKTAAAVAAYAAARTNGSASATDVGGPS
jgi:hypothetical protein